MPGWDLAREGGPWAAEYDVALELGAGVITRRFTFVGRTEELSGLPLPWNDSSFSRLWRFHLHYFDYLFELQAYGAYGAEHRAHAASAFEELATRWIAENPCATGDGWHPYTVSRRLVNWVLASRYFDRGSSDVFRGLLLASISQQARYLARNMEFDVRGNHVLANLRALLCCSLFLKGIDAAKWRMVAFEHFRREVAEQVLPDGGHFERNPGYHLVVLRDLLEIGLWFKRDGGEQPTWLSDAQERMLDYLTAVLPPSGQIPLLKDTAWDEAPHPEGLLALGCLVLGDCRWKRSEAFSLFSAVSAGRSGWETFRHWAVQPAPVPSTQLPDTGHYVLRDDARGDFLVFDAGEPCPPYLSAHAHADLLSYELSVAGRRVVVDSGVCEYSKGPWRDYFRSTRAHNTVEIAGQNQSEVWGSFRAGRRAHPHSVMWRGDERLIHVAAEHDGYTRLRPPVVHRRTLFWQCGCFWLVVDQLFGPGRVAFMNNVHLHSSLSLQPSDELTWEVNGLPFRLWIAALGDVSAQLIRGGVEAQRQGWQSEKFGELMPNTVLGLRGDSSGPVLTAYAISLDEPADLENGGTVEKPVIAVAHLGRRYSYTTVR